MKLPLLSGSSVVVVEAPDGAVVLRPPPPGEPLQDVQAAVRDALRFPLAGEPLAALARRGGRATIVVEPPSPDDEVVLLVWRSIVVRGVNIGQMFFSSFGAMRIGSFELCVHSHRALVSNDTQ